MLPSFEELYVISDLHLGGEEDYQIFTEAKRLKHFIQYLQNRPKDKPLALCLNGDVVDIIGEAGAKGFNSVKGIPLLKGIIQRKPFNQIFKALKSFLHVDNRYLFYVVGNHDLELVLPSVKQYLEDYFLGANPSKDIQKRLIIVSDDNGFECQVKDKKVLCLHGISADCWNISPAKSLLTTKDGKREDEDYYPSAGTKLLLKVINKIKNEYPFINLLSPEFTVALPITLYLDPELRKHIPSAFSVLLKTGQGILRRLRTLEDEEEESNGEEESDASQGPRYMRGEPDAILRRSDSSLILAEVEHFIQNNGDMNELIRQMEYEGTLGWKNNARIGWFSANKARNFDTLEKILNTAIEEDQSHRFNKPDDIFKWLRKARHKLTDESMDFYVCGHSHHQKAIRAMGEGWTYLNPGSWTNKIPFTSPEFVKHLRPDLHTRGLDQNKLDRLMIYLRRKSVSDLIKDNNLIKILYDSPDSHPEESKKSCELCRTDSMVVRIGAEMDGRTGGRVMRVDEKGVPQIINAKGVTC